MSLFSVILLLIVFILFGIECWRVGRNLRDIEIIEMIQLLNNELEKHRKELKTHKDCIELLDTKISSSNIKIDWDEYNKTLKHLGIPVDEYRNLDITNPEG